MANTMQSEQTDKGAEPRVKFTEDTYEIGHDSDITVRSMTPDLIDVHLGFLQVRHRYEIAFTFESRHIDGQLVIRNPDASCPSLYCHVTDLRAAPEPGHYLIVVELFAHKEKLLKEQVHLHSDQNPSQSLTLAFHARVLGKGKGTPFLKNGIKSIGQQMDEDDDDNSDWPGFG